MDPVTITMAGKAAMAMIDVVAFDAVFTTNRQPSLLV